jgi:hypothetical protein
MLFSHVECLFFALLDRKNNRVFIMNHIIEFKPDTTCEPGFRLTLILKSVTSTTGLQIKQTLSP